MPGNKEKEEELLPGDQEKGQELCDWGPGEGTGALHLGSRRRDRSSVIGDQEKGQELLPGDQEKEQELCDWGPGEGTGALCLGTRRRDRSLSLTQIVLLNIRTFHSQLKTERN